MSGYWLGKKRPDIGERIALSNKNRVVTDETRKKMSGARKGEKSVSWKGGLPKCIDCDKQLSRYDASFCKSHSKTGRLNHKWKNGITSKNNKDRAIFRARFQKLVFQRDDYTCKMCDRKGGHLQADHIKSWKDFPELRFDIDNCRTLCMACHYFVTYNKDMPKDTIWGHNFGRRVAS